MKNYASNGVLFIDGSKCTTGITSNTLTGKNTKGLGVNVAGSTVKAVSENIVGGKNSFCISVHKNGGARRL